MATVALFHSVLGVRRGVLDAADLMRAQGHQVVVVDLFDGRTFDEYPAAMSFVWEEVGLAQFLRLALGAVEGLTDGLVTAGFSFGCLPAVYLAAQRPVSAVLMIGGAIPVSAFDEGLSWPAGVPAQTHSMLADPWRSQEEVEQTVRDVEAGGGSIEVFDYPGSGHLFSDPTLPAEYDAAATELLWSRAVPFLASVPPR